MKFTFHGGIHIRVKKSNKYIILEVCDTGIGIKDEDQDKLFKLFGFINNTKHVNRNGIGLGLVIADQITE